ncbi:MAG: cytochrome bc complex cytochrome b subunit [Chloroflexi bacterium]|nr:cytochrome bc complex cytochrome b subunit [Chloroflexota bacterium]
MAVFKLHVPILDDIKAKGLKPALIAKADDVVNRITVGLGVNDIRSVLRGDPPPRPNIRTKPHADGFWFHMRPTYYHNLVASLYPTFRLGWLSVYLFVVELITGVFLMIFYTPSPLVAYENMLSILGNVPFGRLMRDIHKVGAELMVIAVCLHMLRTFLTGSYKKPRQFTWFTGVVLLLTTLVLSFSGYLLPWDQLSLWAVTIGASMVEAIPPQQVGDVVNLIVRGGPLFNAGGLLRWYLLHVLALPATLIVAFGVHYYKVIIHGHSLPPRAEAIGEDTAKRVPTDKRTYFLPDVLTHELYLVALWTFIVVLAAIFFYHAPLETHADPQLTPLHITSPWYFLWLQGMLKLGDKVFWGLVAPGILFSVLFVVGWIEVGPSRRYGDRRVGWSVACVTVVFLAITSFMGTPNYLVTSSPDQEVVAELLPQTEAGPLRKSDWGELTLGEYNAKNWAEAPTPALQRLLRMYNEELERVSKKRLQGAEGFMVIEDWQADLKKVTFRVNWTNSDGSPGTFTQTAFLHRLSNYQQDR